MRTWIKKLIGLLSPDNVRRFRFPILFFSLLSAFCFLLSTLNASGVKSNGSISITDDIFGVSGSALNSSAGIYSVQGFIGNLVSSSHTAGVNIIESGFYSKLVSSPSVYSFDSVSTGSFNNIWTASNPLETDYQIFLSTNDVIEDYFMLYETTESAKSIPDLSANTSYYAFVYANYMDSDISPVVSTVAVTLSVPVSSDTFILKDVGFKSVDLLFSSFENSGPSKYDSWQTYGAGLLQDVYGHSSLTYDGYAYISGGFDGVNFSSAVYQASIDSIGNLGAWTLAGHMPDAKYGHKMLAARGRLYFLGGYNSGGNQNSVYSVSISSEANLGQWSSETNLPTAVYFHSAFQYEGRIYVSGGYSGSVSAAVYNTDISGDGTLGAWSSLTSMTEPRYAHTMNVIGDYVYVIGGKDGANAKSNVWKAQIQTDGAISPWSAATSLPTPRYGHETITVGNNIYVSGGNNGTSAQNLVFQTNAASDASLNPWGSFASLSSVKQFHSGFAIGGKMYITGGTDGTLASSEVYLSTVTGTEYKVEVSLLSSFAALADESYWQSDYNWGFDSLIPNTTYYFRTKSRNWSLTESAYSDYISTLTYAAIPSTAPWTDVSVSSAVARWDFNNNPVGTTLFSCEISSHSDFSLIADSSDTYNDSALFTGLQPTTTYYGRVKAFNRTFNATRFIQLADIKTFFDPALDTSSPTITNNQTGDDIWRSTDTTLYNIDFADTGGSEISKFQIMVATDSGAASGILASWTDVMTGMNTSSYSDDWQLPLSVFDAMIEGVTNYISVRVYDNVSNSSTTIDAFYVQKDTTPPVISVDYTAPVEYLSENPGPVSTVTFSDAVSKLYKTQYSISSNQLSADENILAWTDIGEPSGYSVFEATWSYNFSLLANGTNYFSVRAFDIAGGAKTETDIFKILKNVNGPIVNITSPSDMYLSTITAVTGTSVETASHAVVGTEISFMDKSNNLYWNGAAFISGARVWKVAEGTDSFTVSLNVDLVDGVQYEIVARSSDSAGDYSNSFSTVSFTYDISPPTVGIVSPANNSNAESLSFINGTALDAKANISSVQLMLSRVSDAYWWNGGNWQAGAQTLVAGTTAQWTYAVSEILAASLEDGGTYYATVRAGDNAVSSNIGEFFVQGSTFVYYDTTNPGIANNLSGSIGTLPGSIDLFWSSPGDNGSTGFLLSGNFTIEYSTYAGAAFSTATASIAISTNSLTAGSTCSHRITGLNSSTTYYFVVWTQDDAGNWSDISAIAQAVSGMASIGIISGNITQVSSQAINGVLVEAHDSGDNIISSDYTDAFGDYSISGLDDAIYTVKAIWSANDIESWVSKAGIQSGSIGVDFILNTEYLLANITGFIPLGIGAKTLSSSKYSVQSVVLDTDEMFVEVYLRGRRIVLADIGETGKFSISNLLPGTYSIRAFNGKEFTDMQIIYLKDGEIFNFTPKWDILAKEKVYAYPNPAQSSVKIHLETSVISPEVIIVVFDITGRVIKKFVGTDIPSVGSLMYEAEWNFSNENIASGVYLYMVKVRDPSTNDVKKVIKKLAIIR